MRIFPGAVSAPARSLVPLIGASLLLAGSAFTISSAAAEDAARPAQSLRHPAGTPPERDRQPSFAEMQAKLDRNDQITALHALQMALNQTADGGSFLWQKRNRNLKGIIRPTAAFRNASGRVCRHVIYALSLGEYRKQIEFVACREAGGRWRL